jgi:RNA polymerase sigma-70 factor (ECF subfamily)
VPRQDAPVPIDVGELFKEHVEFLLRVVERLTGHGDHVEDLVQDAFVVAYRRRDELRAGPDVRGWLYRVVSHRAMHHRRSMWRRFRLARSVAAEPTDASDRAEDIVQQRERGAQIRNVVLTLPFHQREVFVLFELEELDGRTIAQLLNIPEGTVASRLHAARRAFREHWTQQRGEQ